MARVKNKFNISIAEVAEHDRLRTAILGAAVVSNDAAYGQAVMEKVIHQIALVDDAVLADYSTETY